PNGKECYEVDECNWSEFKQAFLKFSKNKCPICEIQINQYADIDHYRPESKYEFLKCCCYNYMIMCSSCNRKHKHASFPLNNAKANNIDEVGNEEPLLVNPRKENVFDYFKLVFVMREHGKLVLEIAPKDGLAGAELQKAKETIKIYGIGNCEEDTRIDDCRIDLFEQHYENFIELAEARKTSREKFLELLKNKPKKKDYGFVGFIAKGQFEIVTPT
ncbi:MAG TPA: hypothetical protein PLV58_09540, partial [Campylobacterales bacterium]|nr:hypothetical protein [Campylobacterales bacterium]